MPGLGFVSDCFFRRGMIFCEKFRHLKDWYFGLIPACRDPTMSAVEAAQECWGTQSCLGQKRMFFFYVFLMFFGFVCRLEHYFFGWDWQHRRKGISKTITNRSQ